MSKFLKLDVDIVIEGIDKSGKGIAKYNEYINHLAKVGSLA